MDAKTAARVLKDHGWRPLKTFIEGTPRCYGVWARNKDGSASCEIGTRHRTPEELEAIACWMRDPKAVAEAAKDSRSAG